MRKGFSSTENQIDLRADKPVPHVFIVHIKLTISLSLSGFSLNIYLEYYDIMTKPSVQNTFLRWIAVKLSRELLTCH